MKKYNFSKPLLAMVMAMAILLPCSLTFGMKKIEKLEKTVEKIDKIIDKWDNKDKKTTKNEKTETYAKELALENEEELSRFERFYETIKDKPDRNEITKKFKEEVESIRFKRKK